MKADTERAATDFAGYAFTPAETAPARPGLFILTRAVAGRPLPLYVGEGEDMAAALAAFQAANPKEAGVADGLFVLDRPMARVRLHTLRDIVSRFDPPLNAEHRKAPAAPELAALVEDRGAGLGGLNEQPGAALSVTEDDLKRLVESFYGRAAADPLLGPVFARAIPDWAGHYQIVQNFWSRTLLGTARYSGMPFAAHIPLQLKPEHFTRWVALFKETAGEVLEPVAAARAIAKVEHMSTCFQAGLFPPDLGAGHAHRAHPQPAHPHAG
ncbi:group III truncated hemoglobin [Xanthobacter sp. YC-JY1]|uniref:group III truncated hemoglobin n=1 Tax=Xanthobacter sp. YC-JY1 TaxID=2419844 RepID=UPI001F1BD4F4|nr:group III truncated hemoglobin [Xanthobacter sp. YC-JY1]